MVRSYREEEGSEPYEDVKGLCKVATLDEVREQGYSLNPGRYVGVAETVQEDFDFIERLEELNEELEGLNVEWNSQSVLLAIFVMRGYTIRQSERRCQT
nr:N-6 DNA methylase [Methanosarcina mazei]